jgi:TM2 domain-containing membrane protein YozV
MDSELRVYEPEPSDKNRLLAALLAFFFGIFGAHRFYVGKTGSAIVQLLTIGGLGIWSFIDFVIILFGEFTDEDGFKIRNW